MKKLGFYFKSVFVFGLISALISCSSTGPRKKAETDDASGTQVISSEELPDPDNVGYGYEDPVISEDQMSQDSQRGDRIGSEIYTTPVEGELQTVYFDLDKHHLREDAAEALKENAYYLLENPQALVLVEGHCDDRGSNEYNLSLGEKRAKEVRDYLLETGVEESRVKIISYGEEQPSSVSDSEKGWAANRRAEFKVAQ